MTANREPESRPRELLAWPWLEDVVQTKCGLVVFSSSGELLHINRQAVLWLQIDVIVGQQVAIGCHERSTPQGAVTYLLEDLLGIVSERNEVADWRQIEITSLICVRSRRLLLRGLGIPDSRGMAEARIVMMVEEAPLAEESLSDQWEAAGEMVLGGVSRDVKGGIA